MHETKTQAQQNKEELERKNAELLAQRDDAQFARAGGEGQDRRRLRDRGKRIGVHFGQRLPKPETQRRPCWYCDEYFCCKRDMSLLPRCWLRCHGRGTSHQVGNAKSAEPARRDAGTAEQGHWGI
jgi:hypothetical protein